MTKEQHDVIVGHGIDIGGLPTKQGTIAEATSQWERDCQRMELLVTCQYPTIEVLNILASVRYFDSLEGTVMVSHILSGLQKLPPGFFSLSHPERDMLSI